MSDVDAFRGKLFPVDRRGLSREEWIQKILGDKSLEELGYGDWAEALEEERDYQYLYQQSTDTVYRIERERLDPSYLVSSHRNADGSFDFLVSYYNGGVSFGEVMESVLDGSEL